MREHLYLEALFFGLLSAVSLPLGSILAKYWTPKDRAIAALMAFGGGALLSALTIDLVGESLRKGEFYPLAFGCILGGILFVVLNQVVNKNGGFLRKASTTLNYLKRKKINELKHVFRKMSQMPLFNRLPPEEIHAIVPYIQQKTYKKGSTVIHQGDPGDSFFIIDRGEIDIIDESKGCQKIATLKADDVFGEMALVLGEPRVATAVAVSDTRVWLILKEHFDRLLETSPNLNQILKNLIKNRISDLQSKDFIKPEVANRWFHEVSGHINEEILIPTETEIKEASLACGGAPLAIWLGLLLDGIPESLVIGSSLLHTSISVSLIAGLFLSNFPEALSSSAEMSAHQYPFKKIILMWGSLMVITGIGALLGNIFFVGSPLFVFSLVEGMAAGAMLTMIAETMLPEAFHKGGSITGLSTLFGFLAAIFFKTLE